MKSIPSLRIFKLAMAATLAIIIVWGLSIQPAQANSYVVTLKQVGPNVVATGSGAIDLTGLMSLGNVSGGPIITPRDAFIVTGPAGFFEAFFSPVISGPLGFGSGLEACSVHDRGDFGGVSGFAALLFVPEHYVSG